MAQLHTGKSSLELMHIDILLCIQNVMQPTRIINLKPSNVHVLYPYEPGQFGYSWIVINCSLYFNEEDE